METLKSRRMVTNTSLHHTTPYQTHHQFSKLKSESAVRTNEYIVV